MESWYENGVIYDFASFDTGLWFVRVRDGKVLGWNAAGAESGNQAAPIITSTGTSSASIRAS